VRILRFGILTATLIIAALAIPRAQQRSAQPAPPKKPVASHVVRKAAPPGPLPPLPYEGYPSPRPMPVVNAVYEFAARHPEVLQYVPCFCGCEHSGHVGNDDCFVKSRDASGRITAWDSHGFG
jgi:hypothetical protein